MIDGRVGWNSRLAGRRGEIPANEALWRQRDLGRRGSGGDGGRGRISGGRILGFEEGGSGGCDGSSLGISGGKRPRRGENSVNPRIGEWT